MIYPNNPAGRLYLIIEQGKDKSYINLTYIDVWAKILKTHSRADTFKKISLVVDLVPKIESYFLRLKEENIISNTSNYINKIKTIPEYFIYNPRDIWKNFISKFTPDLITQLQICSDLLSHHLPEKVIQEEALNDLLKKLEDLIKDIKDKNIDIELKNQILKLLLRVKYAIEIYPITGIETLQETNFLNISELLLRLKKFKDSLWFKEVIEVTNIIFTLINITDRIPAIQDTVNKFLGN